MRKIQCWLFVLKQSCICYYIICMTVPLRNCFTSMQDTQIPLWLGGISLSFDSSGSSSFQKSWGQIVLQVNQMWSKESVAKIYCPPSILSFAFVRLGEMETHVY